MIVAAAVILALWAGAWGCWIAGHIVHWRLHPATETAWMRQRVAVLRAINPHATLQYQWVAYERISDQLKRAVIAAEDLHFIHHSGFDWEGIRLAIAENRRQGRIVAGGSTISQQLAKNLFLTPERTYTRKLQEAAITVELETLLTKRRILELYLNVVEWGSDVFGAEAAARHYFGVPAAELTAHQAASLAAIAPRPRFFERDMGDPQLALDIRIILARMPAVALPTGER